MENNELLDFLILYFQSRNVHQWNFVGYKCFKALMTHITGIREVDQLRQIFEKLMKLGYFEKRRIASKCDYRFIFNPALLD